MRFTKRVQITGAVGLCLLIVAVARLDKTNQATRLLARIECESGRHKAELQQARRLMTLAPRDENSLLVLRHAAACNGLESQARQAEAASHRRH